MGLRARVVVLLLLMVLPTMLGFSVWRVATQRRAAQERVAERFVQRGLARPRVQARCLRNPARFTIRRRGLVIHPVILRRGELIAPSLGATQQQLSPGLVAAFRASEEGIAHEWLWRSSELLGQSLVRVPGLPEDAVCATFWIGWNQPTALMATRVRQSIIRDVLILALLMIVVGLVLSAPVVARVRRLTEAARVSPDALFDPGRELNAKDEIGDLARALHQRSEQIRETIGALEARDRTLSEYISNTTHDLAIPLTVLQHRLVSLRDQTEDGQPPELSLIERAMEESHYIAALIANMSAAAKLEAGQAHTVRHPVDLGELIERVAARHDPVAAQKDVELNWAIPHLPVITRGDSTLIEQAVSNLVQNAIQYNEAGGHVGVVLDEGASPGTFELRVLDDGPGVAEERLPLLTQRGVRDDARTRNPDGQGFGLSIASRVFEAHDWSFTLESPPDEGLTAIISGALEPPDDRAGETTATTTTPGAR